MKQNYIYIAIGLDKRYLNWLWRYDLPILQMYIGVRTGVLPDNSYKTSSSNKQWLYLCKYPLAIFETREQANEAELELLQLCKANGIFSLLANKAIGKMYVWTEEQRSAKARYMAGNRLWKNRASTAGKYAGKNSAWFGRRHSEETKNKQRLAALGKTQSMDRRLLAQYKHLIALQNKRGSCHLHNAEKLQALEAYLQYA